MNTMISKQCPIQRPVYSFITVHQKETVGISRNGDLHQGPPQMEQLVNQVSAANHELRIFGNAEDYMMYCIFCGTVGAQGDWVTVLGFTNVT